MKSSKHSRQRAIWEAEHRAPELFPYLASERASDRVLEFWEWLRSQESGGALRGVEIGCGKGRNCLGLAAAGAEMTGFDFSPTAIAAANDRALAMALRERARFRVHDATEAWPFADASFDFAVDFFASIDIETRVGRSYARDELRRVLRPGGHLLVYVPSAEDEYHRVLLAESPAEEENTFYYPGSEKIEKLYDHAELRAFYRDWSVVLERRIERSCRLHGRDYTSSSFWVILRR